MLTGAFLRLPYGSMPEADTLKHPQSFYSKTPRFQFPVRPEN